MNKQLLMCTALTLLIGCSEQPEGTSKVPAAKSATLSEISLQTEQPTTEVKVSSEAEVKVDEPVKAVITPDEAAATKIELPKLDSQQVLQAVVEKKAKTVTPEVITKAPPKATAVQVAMLGSVPVIEKIASKIPVTQDVTTQRILNNQEKKALAELPETDRFVKVDNKGKWQLPAVASWNCVLDRNTGLLWETKSSGKLRHHQYQYAQSESGGQCAGNDCSITAYVQLVNEAKLCGRSDWRLPKRLELLRLVDYAFLESIPSIDIRYFSNTEKSRYWSADRFEYNEGYYWSINFKDGFDYIHNQNKTAHLRLVTE